MIAHEASHVYIHQYGTMVPLGQSSVIGEAFGDMTGEVAEYYALTELGWPSQRAMPDYLFGADVKKGVEDAERNLCEPRSDGISIDHMDDFDPNRKPHHNAGILNKAFCLLSKKDGWDPLSAYEVFYYTATAWKREETFREYRQFSRPGSSYPWPFC